MIKYEGILGTTELHRHYFSDLIGHTVTSCFGVAGMANSGASQSLRQHLFKAHSYIDQGVCGVNVNAVVDSIKNKVNYTVTEATGLKVKKIEVFIDGMKE